MKKQILFLIFGLVLFTSHSKASNDHQIEKCHSTFGPKSLGKTTQDLVLTKSDQTLSATIYRSTPLNGMIIFKSSSVEVQKLNLQEINAFDPKSDSLFNILKTYETIGNVSLLGKASLITRYTLSFSDSKFLFDVIRDSQNNILFSGYSMEGFNGADFFNLCI